MKTPVAANGQPAPLPEDSAEALGDAFVRYLFNHLGRDRLRGEPTHRYHALVYALRERVMERWRGTRRSYNQSDCRRAFYLSLEYLMGRATHNAIINLGIEDIVKEALQEHDLNLGELLEEEHDAGLGNGGLGRLAACFLDSCATLSLPVMGYGLRYEYGIFRQGIQDGHQVEEPDRWLSEGHPWEIRRSEHTVRVGFGGRSESYRDMQGNLHHRVVDTREVLAMPYDVPIPGFENGTVNTLRLWKAVPTDEFDFAEFNEGDYPEAVRAKTEAENITLVLYPNDKSENGKELRLRQQYLLASASLQDILRRWTEHNDGFDNFADKTVFQLNDTHPTIAIPELMRLLMDDHGVAWDNAWEIVRKTMAYTNHTLLPEALERWPVHMLKRLLPRVMDIIFEINARFLREVANRWPGDEAKQARLSIIEEGDGQNVRMAHLALVGSFSVNGVAELHTELLKSGLFSEFHALWPERFNNKTNGVTQRRWLRGCNPELSSLITEAIGDGWVTDLSQLERLKPMADNAAFRKRWQLVRRHNKNRVAALVRRDTGVDFDVDALFDVQVKRIHEYKRQLMLALHAVHLYDRIKRGDAANWTPRNILVGGKAAPGYVMAKCIIKLTNAVAHVINNDPDTEGKLRLVFLPNYNVSKMEVICAGTDLSEQISTAGKEASGTGNMKFMMNGSLTIGTLDGANIEIREEVGADNFFLFGLTADEVAQHRPVHNPRAAVDANEDLQRVIGLLQRGHFNPYEPGVFDPILRNLFDEGDTWMVLADFADYIRAQEEAAQLFQQKDDWTRRSILNTATAGKFSTDRTMQEYNRDIWRLSAVPAMQAPLPTPNKRS